MAGLRLLSGDRLEVGALLRRGGQGEIIDVVHPQGAVFKRIHASVLTADTTYPNRIQLMVTNRPSGWQERGSQHVMLAWPTDVVVDSHNRFTGFLMPRIDTARTVELHEVANPSSRRQGSGPSAWVRGFTWRYLVRTASNLSLATASLHDAEVVIGDFNERNVLVWDDARVTLLDCDSMQITDERAGTRYLCIVGRPEFTAPELLGTDWRSTVRARSSDLFALAIHLHQLLLEGGHPFDGVWSGPGEKPKRHVLAREGIWAHGTDHRLAPPPGTVTASILPDEIRGLFSRAFVDGATNPRSRPTAIEWSQALTSLQERLKSCRDAPDHFFSPHLVICPWCYQSQQRAAQQRPLPRATAPITSLPAAQPPATAPVRRPIAPPSVAPAHSPISVSPSSYSPVNRARRLLHATSEIRRAYWQTTALLAIITGLAVLIQENWVPYSFQTVPDVIPYGAGWRLLARIALSTAVPALVVSLIADTAFWRLRSSSFAFRRWPIWHSVPVRLAMVAPGLIVWLAHRGQPLDSWGGSAFGPPQWVWWMTPITVLCVHFACLALRFTVLLARRP